MIRDYAFLGQQDLTGFEIPAGITTIGRSAFFGCSGLTSLTIPPGVTTIGQLAFHGCSGLKSIVLPVGVTTIGQQAFSGCSGLTSIVIPEGVTIGKGAFRDCSGLTSIVLPEGVTSIESDTFANCRGLTSVVIPKGVTTIGSFAFSSCTGLTSVVIPEGVTTIGGQAFYYCTSLNVVYIMCNESNFSALQVRMKQHILGQNVEFKCIPERSIGIIINKIKLHLSGKTLELNVPPTNFDAVLKRPRNHPLSIYTPQALQYNNFLAGEPHRQRILTDVRNLFAACRWSLAQQVTPLPHELWEHIFSFVFYQVLGPRRFNQLRTSLCTPGRMSYHENGPLFSAIQPPIQL